MEHHRFSMLHAIVTAAALMLVPVRGAYAHHLSSIGSAFWHDFIHMLANGVPLLLLASALVMMWYLRKVER